MDPRFFRKYADLVESAEKDLPVQQFCLLYTSDAADE